MKFATRWLSAAAARAAGTLAALTLLTVSASPTQAAVPVGLLAAQLPTQAGYGTIKGRLVLDAASAPPRIVLQEKGQAQKDGQVCAKDEAILDDKFVVDPKTKGIQFGFAYLAKPNGKNPEALKAIATKAPEVVVDQVNCRFVPHNVAVTTDQTVIFKSSDPTSHNLRYAGFANGGFNQMMPAKSEVEKKFSVEKRPIAVGCDLHPWMTGYLMVFDHPFFAVTGEDGSFEIKGVPAGKQNVVVWQEKAGYVTPGFAVGVPVEVKADATVDLGDVKLDPKKIKP
ncbi:carboxypeptidase regulatory-like domain-containing protein [Singulisphaera sp. Ch08]|uniref:Carboxypeptidase regulatory-like domain-containing protein n=1 Tax=Singulisphaera sp. Ch08 TaxID=3120278 RepID=A0AAU7CFF2_9BACT